MLIFHTNIYVCIYLYIYILCIYILGIKVYPFIICHELSCYVPKIKLKIEERNAEYVKVGNFVMKVKTID